MTLRRNKPKHALYVSTNAERSLVLTGCLQVRNSQWCQRVRVECGKWFRGSRCRFITYKVNRSSDKRIQLKPLEGAEAGGVGGFFKGVGKVSASGATSFLVLI